MRSSSASSTASSRRPRSSPPVSMPRPCAASPAWSSPANTSAARPHRDRRSRRARSAATAVIRLRPAGAEALHDEALEQRVGLAFGEALVDETLLDREQQLGLLVEVQFLRAAVGVDAA